MLTNFNASTIFRRLRQTTCITKHNHHYDYDYDYYYSLAPPCSHDTRTNFKFANCNGQFFAEFNVANNQNNGSMQTHISRPQTLKFRSQSQSNYCENCNLPKKFNNICNMPFMKCMNDVYTKYNFVQICFFVSAQYDGDSDGMRVAAH